MVQCLLGINLQSLGRLRCCSLTFIRKATFEILLVPLGVVVVEQVHEVRFKVWVGFGPILHKGFFDDKAAIRQRDTNSVFWELQLLKFRQVICAAAELWESW